MSEDESGQGRRRETAALEAIAAALEADQTTTPGATAPATLTPAQPDRAPSAAPASSPAQPSRRSRHRKKGTNQA